MTAVLPAEQTGRGVESDVRQRPGTPGWVRGLDAAMSGGVAAFAVWTLIYEAGLALQWPVTPLTIVWLVTALPLGFLVARASYREELQADDRTLSAAGAPSGETDLETPATVRARRPHLRLRSGVRLWPAALLAVCAAVLLAFGAGWLFWAGWTLALAALAWIAAHLRLSVFPSRSQDEHEVGDSGSRSSGAGSAGWHSVVVVLVGLLVSAGSLFVYRVNPDDAYYLNLSTWTAARDHFPLRDTMFSDQAYPSSYGGGFPISSIEGLIGALARLTGLSAGTMAYLVIGPVLGFASIWALGQLARIWTPRHVLPVFAISAFFILVGQGRGNAYRSYSIYSIWDGKVVAVAILLPLIWIYAARLAASRRGHWIRMFGLVGIAFIGLTSTAAILAPVIGCALLLAAAMLRNAKIALGALAMVVAPLMGGAAVALLSQSVGGPHPKAPTPWQALHHAYGSTSSTLVLVIMVAVLLAPLLLRGPQVRALAWSAAAAPLLVLAPGVLALGNVLTSSAPVEWRLVLVPPVPTLVGTLTVAIITWCVTVASHRSMIRTAVAVVTTAAALVTLSLAGGMSPRIAGLHVSPTPVWKVKQPPLHNVEALIATGPPRGQLILMPPKEMQVLAVYTVEWHAVVPRSLYIESLPEPARLKSARKVLLRLAAHEHPSPSRRHVKEALNLLNVGTVCLSRADHSGQRSVRAAGFGPFTTVGTLRCAYRTGASRALGTSGGR